MSLSTREAYGRALVALAEKRDFVVLDADLSKATQTCLFAKAYPDRFFDLGIAEGHMMNVAAGMAACGETVFASTFAIFGAGRAYEQIRNGIAYTGLNVKIACSHGGVLIGEDGGSHQAIEDLALMRVLPGMTVIAPCDELSTYAAVEAALAVDGPVYLRFGRFPVPAVYTPRTIKFEIGKGNVLRDGRDCVVFALGDMVFEALEAAKMLAERGVDIAVVDLHTVKPIDREIVLTLAKKTRAVVTAEDHSVIGGLGSAVADALSETPIAYQERVGIKDQFGQSGSSAALKEYFGLNAVNIARACERAMARRDAHD